MIQIRTQDLRDSYPHPCCLHSSLASARFITSGFTTAVHQDFADSNENVQADPADSANADINRNADVQEKGMLVIMTNSIMVMTGYYI